MDKELYNNLKELISYSRLPSCIFSVEKKEDGGCGEIRFFAVNEPFKRSYFSVFSESNDLVIKYEDFDEFIEGNIYCTYIPREPKFEDIVFKAAWMGEHIHTYVDTTKMYGYWTEDFLFPVSCEHEDNIAYCQFMYSLTKDMDTDKRSFSSPDVTNFVVKTCLELKQDSDFISTLNTIGKDIREYTNSFASSILSIDSEHRTFEILSESVLNNAFSIKEIFDKFSYDVIDDWLMLLKETNSIIIQTEDDMKLYEQQAPEWVATLRRDGVKSLVLVPFIHRGLTIGFLYITNFDISQTTEIKECIELISFFLGSELANHLFLQKLEYLSNIDTLTGVYNRNCMNINVDELSLKLQLNPQPFSVAFCDLNGLKTINDNGGHAKGDSLLQEAAKILKEIFAGDKIFRAGGDEFVIISFDPTEEEFAAKINKLKERAHDPEWLYFAVGYYHDARNGNLRLAMRYADEVMYIDKNKFYASNPNMRR